MKSKMNHASNSSGLTHTTLVDGDTASSTISHDDRSNCGEDELTTPSLSSIHSISTPAIMEGTGVCGSPDDDMVLHHIFNYKLGDFVAYTHLSSSTCEDICLDFCRSLGILPTTRLLFGLRVYTDSTNENTQVQQWIPPGNQLHAKERYCFRMRFKVHQLDTHLQALDPQSYEYLYRQMRVDMVRECIPEIRYPAKKDNVMGLGVVDMYIDLLERCDSVERIEANYKRYLPRQLVKAHKVFVKPKICNSFRQFRGKNIDLGRVKWNYVHEVHSLAPNYLMEVFTAVVDYIPDEDTPQDAIAGRSAVTNCSNINSAGQHVYVKLDLYDAAEPGIKVARITSKDKLKWILLTKLDDINTLYTEGRQFVCLEITNFPNGYRLQFKSKAELEAFITYMTGYHRLTSKWAMDLCAQYVTPSLKEMNALKYHGPIGGSFSFSILRESHDQSIKQLCRYLIRQCEKEYDTYYIDMITKSYGLQSRKCKIETFKIKKDNSNSKWILHFNDSLVTFDDLTHLAQYIPAEWDQKLRIPSSPYHKPLLLLICLPKNLQSKKTETELSAAELQRKSVAIINPKTELQWYKNSPRECDNGKMIKIKADWLLKGTFKEVCVTLKVLKSDKFLADFTKFADIFSQIYSPHFIKLYGLTLSAPHTMVMEYAGYGPFNEFLLRHKNKVSLSALVDVVFGLLRGIIYLRESGIVHGNIRCSNLFVTQFDPKSELIEVKFGDPGFPRSYRNDELPWIPFEYHKNLNEARNKPDADLWAFATTIWEIFARGSPITCTTSESLFQNYNFYGAILPSPSEDCPEKMYAAMMDGWIVDPNKTFNQHVMFAHLHEIRDEWSKCYETVNIDNEFTDESEETSSQHSESRYLTWATFDGHNNGHSVSDIQSAFSSNSTTCESAPLLPLLSSQHLNNGRQDGRMQNFVLKIPNGKVVCKEQIGEGHYGTVFLGEMHTNKRREQVAIKMLKSSGTKQMDKDFMREIEIMQKLEHPNIVKIKQWVDNPISIIMEYFELGSFIVYLSAHKPNLKDEQLLHFSLDIAKGMDYLSEQKVIHRDLAARNILVDSGDRVKISDFGLAQRANQDGYYFAKSNREIPIKWYSPESIKTDKFSFQSDVWSYGITLFEIFSRGEIPYLEPDKELSPEVFIQRLENGDRLRKPKLCKDVVYEKLMLPCWHGIPKKRPKFKELIEQILLILNENGESI